MGKKTTVKFSFTDLMEVNTSYERVLVPFDASCAAELFSELLSTFTV